MKHIIIVIILLITLNCYCQIYFAWQEPIDEIFIEETIDHQVFTEEGVFLLIHVDFAPYDYCVGTRENDARFNCYTNKGSYRHQITIKYYVTVYVPSNIEIKDFDEPELETIKIGKGNMNSSLDVEFNELAIKSLDIYADIKTINPDYPPPEITINNISITNLTCVNPEYPDKCEADIWMKGNHFKSGDSIPIYLTRGFYFGYESQFVDIYLVYFNYINLYFFPSMSTEIDKITIFIPQYTMVRCEDILIGEVNIDDLNPNKGGLNAFAFTVAPEGTIDFLNEIYPRTFNYVE